MPWPKMATTPPPDLSVAASIPNRPVIVREGISGLALRSGDWKFIRPHKGQVRVEIGESA
jgi:hypothetical protein